MPYVWVPDTIEYPPLFPPELRPFTIPALRALCADGFSLSDTRELIMCCIEHLVKVLSDAGIVGDLWIDGSFLTEKIDPQDADIVLVMEADFADKATAEQHEVITWFTDEFDAVHRYLRCHCFPIFIYPRGHVQYWEGVYGYAYWLRQWGFSRSHVLKGIAVIELNRERP